MRAASEGSGTETNPRGDLQLIQSSPETSSLSSLLSSSSSPQVIRMSSLPSSLSSSLRLSVVVVLSSLLAVVCEGSCPTKMTSRSPNSKNDYGVLIDAGSSGTRVWVYSWPRTEGRGPNDPPGPTVPPIECVFSHKVSKGLAEYAEDLHELRKIVLTLIHEAKRKVPDQLHSSTSIFLMATAGMRLLLEDKAIIVVEEIDALFRNTTLNPFMYDSPHNTRILSGEEEGVFAWIAVNYLSGRLTNFDGDLYRTTSGILELGGASTQIAFIPRGSVLSDKFPVFIGGEKYPIYVHSYLIYGQDHVERSIHHQVIRTHTNGTNYTNPCMLRGEETTTTEGKRLIGTGNTAGCVAILEKLINKVDGRHCFPKPCAIGSVYQPNIPPNQTFYTIGAFYFILKDLKVISPNGTFTPAQVYEAAAGFCSKDFETAKREMNRSAEDEKFVSKPCSIGLYMYLLFTEGYHFKNDTRQIIAAEKINNHPIDWTLGALIYENDYRMTSQCRKNDATTTTTNGGSGGMHIAPSGRHPIGSSSSSIFALFSYSLYYKMSLMLIAYLILS